MEEQRIRELIHEEMRVVMRPQPGEILKLQYELQDARKKITELEAEQKKAVSGEKAEVLRLMEGDTIHVNSGPFVHRVDGPAILILMKEGSCVGIDDDKPVAGGSRRYDNG